ncbi:MAG TPA: magnesium transporter [Kofleriaceae bacterium]|jgi:magnesium transporter|nr:magnesium transporter [Kofleriaceae bacterium]
MHGEDGEDVHSAVPVPDLSFLDRPLRGGDDDALKRALKNVRPADLGRELSRRSVADGTKLLHAIDDRHGAAMLRAAHPAAAASLLSGCEGDRAARLLAFLPTEHEVAILSQVPADARAKIEQAYTAEQKASIDRQLAHPEPAVGRLMTAKIWRCESTKTAGEAMAGLRAQDADIEVAVNCYFTDAGRLVGVAPLRVISIAEPSTPIAQLMTPDPLAVRETAARGDAAEIITAHDFLSLPVVDKDDKLVGVVRVDDLLGATLRQVGVGVLNQGGVAGRIAGRAPYFLTPLLRTVRSRITWLILLFVAETATGTVLRYFDDELAKVVALSFFVPLLIGTGGNAGSQTVSTIIRALALGEVRTRDVMRVVRREVSAGVLLGVLLGTIAFFRALLWGVDYDLAACVAVTILVVCTWANAVGATIPLVAQRVGIDPTVISAPLITTLVDASGLFIYFSVAKLMIAALSTNPAAIEIPKWQSAAIVATGEHGDVRVEAKGDAAGHVNALAIHGRGAELDVPPAYLASLPPMQLDTLALRGDHGALDIGFATGGKDDEHVQLEVSPVGAGKLTRARIVRVTREGKEKVETRPPP